MNPSFFVQRLLWSILAVFVLFNIFDIVIIVFNVDVVAVCVLVL